MAYSLTVNDAYDFVNSVVEELSGMNDTAQAIDPTSYISVGDDILSSYPTENIMNAMGQVMGRMFIDVRPYKSKYNLIDVEDKSMFASIQRDISFMSKEALPSGYFNTNLYTNLKNGFDNGSNSGSSTASMWVQDLPVPFELDFGGMDTWQDEITLTEKQLNTVFHDAAEMAEWLSGVMTEKGNDIEQQKEALNRGLVLNHMVGLYQLKAQSVNDTVAVNLTYEFNQKFGTSYTSAQLRSTYLKEFSEFLASTIKTNSIKLENRSASYGFGPFSKTVGSDTYYLKRHTPRANQKLFLYAPLLTDVSTMVMPEIFNDDYLKIDNYEGVPFWQNEYEGSKIKLSKASVFAEIGGDDERIDITFGSSAGQTSMDFDNIYWVGLQFDERALACKNFLEEVLTTPIEARKGYRNMWYTFAHRYVANFSHKAIVYYMEDPAPEPDPGT